VTIGSCNIPLQEDPTGTIHVENTRVTLDSVVLAFLEGATVEEIAERLPAISISSIFATIAFYLQNQDEVDDYLARRGADAAQTRMKIESRPEFQEFRRRLLARRSGNGLS
jgi:uncharacterized protein (DUF433 family)